MPSFPFQVEVVDPGGRFVMCRELEQNRFRLAPGSQLGGVEVTHVSQPSPIGPDGDPRVDLYLFRIKRPEDAKRFKVGETVMLQADPAPRILLPDLLK